MSQEHETAYPRLKKQYSQKELERYHTPDDAELSLARQNTRQPTARICFLLLMKITQHLGYFVQVREIPKLFLRHITSCLGYDRKLIPNASQLKSYDRSGTRQRHLQTLRCALGIKPFGQAGIELVESTALRAASTKEHVTDIINEVLEELVRQYYELRSFSILDDSATKAWKKVRLNFFAEYRQQLSLPILYHLDKLLDVNQSDDHFSLWNKYRRECGKPTSKVIKEYLKWLTSIKEQAESLPEITGLPAARKKALFHEARSYDAKSMRRLQANKRYTLTALLVRQRYASALDDVANIFIRLVRQLHHTAKQSYQEYRLKNTGDTDQLVTRFYKILQAWNADGSPDTTQVDELLNSDTEQWLSACERYLKLADDNYYPFLVSHYQKKRSQLFNCLELLKLKPTSEDDQLLHALEWINLNRHLRRTEFDDIPESLSDGQWLTEPWLRVIERQREADGQMVWRKNYLELAVFSLIMEALNAGDLCIEAGDMFSDYRDKLISLEQYQDHIEEYSRQSGIATDPDAFVEELKQSLESAASLADDSFPDCQHVRFEAGCLKLSRPESKVPTAKVAEIKRLIDECMPSLSILDVLIEAERWLDLHTLFALPSGEKSRVSEPRKRFVTTLFCYGCNLGPTQVARSVQGLSRKQIAWLSIGYISEPDLDKAITKTINAYNRFQLPKSWGTGERAAADGTRFDVYQQNLFSEYHIRYGSYGGVGYYFVSDTYAALFSRFITCGSYEGAYILDVLMNNQSDIQPSILHGDTHAQNEPAFGLAYLLGIELMPRIRKVSKLRFFRPEAGARYQHIDSLFEQTINWSLIKKYLPDMLRVALSIKHGTIDPSAILQRLGSGTRKNRLYFAFRELGRAVKTRFLLKYIMDIDLRKTINQATNKCEEFNDFCKWLMFGGDGVIAENLRHEQQKIIKYNQLVSNLTILHNVQNMTRALKEIASEGVEITPDILADLSPYWRKHINRFGDYRPDYDIPVSKLEYDLILSMML
ncbi:Tn3 family transposase [Endozoicomonas sp. ONNA2]|uniref:Tn3 family transposase n=1 Tax=Endozoicomonas sp. ONNA2 TaxID=2828741 RepID=UPI002148B74B